VLFAVWGLLGGGVLAATQAPPYRVAVLTPGLTFGPVLEGLREGLAQLGYPEGKNITFIIEDTQGDVAVLGSRATRIVAAKPHLIVLGDWPRPRPSRQHNASIVFGVVADLRQASSPATLHRRTI
jgi:hypothetical protein